MAAWAYQNPTHCIPLDAKPQHLLSGCTQLYFQRIASSTLGPVSTMHTRLCIPHPAASLDRGI